MCDISEVKELCFSGIFDVWSEGERGIQDDAKVVYQCI